MIALTRRYRFSASHRLHVNSLSERENAALFGKCNNPFGHGHDYILSVTIAGEPSTETGVIVPVSKLDDLVEHRVLRVFAHRNLNVDVTSLKDIVPTTENVLLAIANILQEEWREYFGNDSDSKIVQIRLQETERNSFEIRLATRSQRLNAVLSSNHESVPINA
jgi:6-pyruvoyltetrahydropterin/6-carboxytetrahydropterin synthase